LLGSDSVRLDDLRKAALYSVGSPQQAKRRLLLARAKIFRRLLIGRHSLSVFTAETLSKQMRLFAAERLQRAVPSL
jgi:hypothetical protein